jgi:hypothetical protein
MYDVLIMQGRLSPRPEHPPYQRTPPYPWNEIEDAKNMGYDGVEWVLGQGGYVSMHPSMFLEYTRNIPVFLLDCIMSRGIEAFSDLLQTLTPYVLGKTIVVPVLEDMKDKRAMSIATHLWEGLSTTTGTVAVETDIPIDYQRWLCLLMNINSADYYRHGICYDTGNMVEIGSDCSRDIALLGKHLKHMHLKDKREGSPHSVPLGEGDVDFRGVFKALRGIDYKGRVTVQGAFQEDYTTAAIQYLRRVKEWMK